MIKLGRSILVLCAGVCASLPAKALDPDRRISQYAHTAWRVQDGAFSGTPNAIAQTRDGYLWIGTDGGLLRFDGVRFVPWNPPSRRVFDLRIYSLLGAHDGTLWIGTGSGPVHWTGDDWVEFPGTGARINSFVEDRDRSVWMSRSRVQDRSGPLCHIVSNAINCYANRDGIPVPYAGPLAIDAHGYMWMGSASTLSRWKRGSYTAYVPKGLERAENLTGVNGLAVARDDSVWVGIQRAGAGLGLQRFVQEQWRPFITKDFDGSKLEVTTLFLDREDSLWIGTAKDGVYRIHNNAVDHFHRADGLSGDSVNCFFQDAEGTLWVATSRGIDSFHDLRITTFSTAEGLTSDRAGAIAAAPDGTIWIANSGALDSIRGGRVFSIRPENGLPGTRVTALLEDHTGKLWVGIDNGLWTYERDHFSPVTASGKPIGTTIAMAEDANGNVWAAVAANPSKLVRIQGNRVIEEVPSTRVHGDLVSDRTGVWTSLSNGDLGRYQDGRLAAYPMKTSADMGGIVSVYLDVDGGLWGVTETGLVRRQNGQVKSLGVENGYGNQSTYALIVDGEGSLWAYTSTGLLRITRQELNRWWKSPDATIEISRFDVFDGAQPAAASFRPRVTRSPDGQLWFANDNVVQVIDPYHIRTNSVPPPVQIGEIIADRKTYSVGRGLRLPALTRDLEVDYAGLSFVAPQKISFRYLLEGRDKSWQDVGSRRQALYSDLSPGKYRFRVIAANADGVWNESGAAVEFTILPAFYQTQWFRALSVIAGLSLVWLIYRLRLRQVGNTLKERFEERIAERTRLARELHDTLLQTLQGSKLFADTSLSGPPDPTRMRDTIVSLSGWLERAMTEVRASLNSLRTAPLQREDLTDLLRRVAEDCRQGAAIQLDFVTLGLMDHSEPEMDPIAREEIYRIGYEAILNACRHSQANRLEVKLSYLPDFCLSIRDNGKGVDPGIAAGGKDGHFGLQGMRERAVRINGVLTITSEVGAGTTIDLLVPAKIAFPGQHRWNALLKRIGLLFKAPDQMPN
jgi:signal transduction histidine kinase/ligand-binding sensor domain-containing protein